jgi:hypothetical protein
VSAWLETNNLNISKNNSSSKHLAHHVTQTQSKQTCNISSCVTAVTAPHSAVTAAHASTWIRARAIGVTSEQVPMLASIIVAC